MPDFLERGYVALVQLLLRRSGLMRPRHRGIDTMRDRLRTSEQLVANLQFENWKLRQDLAAAKRSISDIHPGPASADR